MPQRPEQLRALVEALPRRARADPGARHARRADAARARRQADPPGAAASRRATRSARASRACCRRPPRSSSCTRSRSSTTTCRRSTTTASGAARRRCGRSTARRPRSSPATRCSPRRFRLALTYPTARGRARARRRDARDDRRPAARPRGRARRSSELHCAEDRRALLGFGRCARSGRPRCPMPSTGRGGRSRGELGLLFQIVDDLLDGDGYRARGRRDGARRLADEAAERAHARLATIDADTTCSRQIVGGLAVAHGR